LKTLKDYEAQEIRPNLEYIRRELIELTEEYVNTYAIVNEINSKEENNDYLDFHARRLVEMAGNIIMGYILLSDTMRDSENENITVLFIKRSKAQNRERAVYIKHSELKDLGIYKK